MNGMYRISQELFRFVFSEIIKPNPTFYVAYYMEIQP